MILTDTDDLTIGTTSIEEISTDGTLASNSDEKICTQKAIKTYVDTSVALENIFDRSGGGVITAYVPTDTLTMAGITMTNTVTEFSIDGTLTGNSDTAIPTEKAVKTYVDTAVAVENIFDRSGGGVITAYVPTDTLTMAGITITGSTGIQYANTGVLTDATIGTSLSFVAPTLNTIQDIRTTATPTFAGLTLVNAITEFSTDDTMAGDSDSAVPTEQAVKAFAEGLLTAHNLTHTHTDIALNTTHRTSNGTDHTYIDQDVTSGADVSFGDLTIVTTKNLIITDATNNTLTYFDGSNQLVSASLGTDFAAFTGTLNLAETITVDTINEGTGASGVTVDTLNIDNANITAAEKLLYHDATRVMKEVVLGGNITFTSGTINTSATPTFTGMTLTGFTSLLYSNAGALTDATIGGNLTFTAGTLNTSATPTFTGMTLTGFTSLLYSNAGALTDATIASNLTFTAGTLDLASSITAATKVTTAKLENSGGITIDANNTFDTIISLENQNSGNLTVNVIGVLRSDTILEYTTDTGVTIETLNIEDANITAAEKLLYHDASKVLKEISLASNLSLSSGTLDLASSITAATKVTTAKLENTGNITIDAVGGSETTITFDNSGAGAATLWSVDTYQNTIAASGTPHAIFINDAGEFGTDPSILRSKINITDIDDFDFTNYKSKKFQLRKFEKQKDGKVKYLNEPMGQYRYGLIAEDVEKLDSIFTTKTKEGDLMGINYYYFIGPLISSVKALQLEREKNKKLREFIKSKFDDYIM
jgi:hypothetical protein